PAATRDEVVVGRDRAEFLVEFPGAPEVVRRVGVEVTSLDDEAEPHYVGANRRLAPGQVLVVPGRAEGVEEIAEIMGAIDPAALVLVERGFLDARYIGDQRGDEDQRDDDHVDQPAAAAHGLPAVGRHRYRPGRFGRVRGSRGRVMRRRSEEHTSELQSRENLV